MMIQHDGTVRSKKISGSMIRCRLINLSINSPIARLMNFVPFFVGRGTTTRCVIPNCTIGAMEGSFTDHEFR
jgi:hypothetical protein